MAKLEWTVRVVNFGSDGDPFASGTMNHISGTWVEQLRYMGHCKELAAFYEPTERQVLEFYAPRGTDSAIWSRQNAERMQSFGICAVAAPKWVSSHATGGGNLRDLERMGVGSGKV